MAAYMRLSKEDNENMILNSISNQRVLINEYIAKHQDLNVIDYYIDNRYSGTSFNRNKSTVQIYYTKFLKKGEYN